MSSASEEKDLRSEADLRVERWFMSPHLRQHMQTAKEVFKPESTAPYIALSRQAGTDGQRIARIVGQKLDWDVLDKELLDFMTQRFSLPREMLSVVDENRSNWFYDVLGSFANSQIVSHDNYVVHLERILCLAAMHGNVVFVGRGAHLILPRESGLSVRIVAPLRKRIQNVMQRRQVDHNEAAAWIDKVETDRREFSKRYFHHDVDNVDDYDLVINTDKLTAEQTAEVIVDVAKRMQFVA